MTPSRSFSAVRSYQISSAGVVVDASPHRQVSLLLEGAIERINRSIAAIRQHDVSAKLRSVDGALEIVRYLKNVLDLQAGGMLARRLAGLYDYMLTRLLKANLDNDARGLEEVGSLLHTIKSGWDGIAASPAAR